MRRPVASSLACAALVAAACGSALRDTPARRYEGILLDARELGARELARVESEDPVVRDWVAREGQPDFVLVASPQDVELVYYQASKIVLFHRPGPDAPSLTGVADPLPSSIRPLLPADLRAGTPVPEGGPTAACWTIDVAADRCRTCCQTAIACTIDCTPRNP